MDVHAERLTGHVDEPHRHINPIAARDARKVQDRRLRQQAIRDVAAHAHIPVGRFEQRVPERSSAVVRELHGERHGNGVLKAPAGPALRRVSVSAADQSTLVSRRLQSVPVKFEV
eukprot:scaffold46091_cov92-Phaeocystis_antarctica.AAC.5